MRTVLDSLRDKLIVSCRALEDKPLHNPFIMPRMALTAAQGGAAGIHTNNVADVSTIKEIVSFLVIGVIKRDYPGSEVFIMATLREVDKLMTVGPEIIILDTTACLRPGGQTLEEPVMQTRARYPSVLLMADITTVEGAVTVERLGFGCVGTTLYGYIAEATRHVLAESDCGFLREVLAAISVPVMAERNTDIPERATRCLTLGTHIVVAGGVITRPQQVTTRLIAVIAS